MGRFLSLLAMTVLVPGPGFGAPDAGDPEADLPKHLRDRGPGVHTSQFGTYVLHGELLVYPFFEYYQDADAEYAPAELGYGLDQDFRGEYEASEYLIFLAYGLTPRFSVELEAAAITAELERSPDDPTAMPEELSESGLGDVQTQVNWMWSPETASRPGWFSFGEVVFPFQRDKVLIGTRDWELKLGTGVVRGFSWGTTTLRVAMEYDGAEDQVGMGEAALEYLKRLSRTWRIYGAVEGSEDEWELITEAQVHVSRRAFLKLNNAVGLTSKATDWAPEVGVVFRF